MNNNIHLTFILYDTIYIFIHILNTFKYSLDKIHFNRQLSGCLVFFRQNGFDGKLK